MLTSMVSNLFWKVLFFLLTITHFQVRHILPIKVFHASFFAEVSVYRESIVLPECPAFLNAPCGEEAQHKLKKRYF